MAALNCGLPVVVYNLPFYEEMYGNLLYKGELNNIEGFSRKIINGVDEKTTKFVELPRLIARLNSDRK